MSLSELRKAVGVHKRLSTREADWERNIDEINDAAVKIIAILQGLGLRIDRWSNEVEEETAKDMFSSMLQAAHNLFKRQYGTAL